MRLRIAVICLGVSTVVGIAACVREDPIDSDPRTCVSGTTVEALKACMASGVGPLPCVKQQPSVLCDSDWDGLGDDLEEALAAAYAPAFVFNSGNTEGNHETNWPGNVKDFVANSRLVYREDGEEPTVVSESASLETLFKATAGADGGTAARADLPGKAQGGNFWLCMKQVEDAQKLATVADMRALPNGVDVTVIAHPANGRFGESNLLYVHYLLFFHYNEFAVLDDHEGDWEGVGVFIDKNTGAVDSVYFNRHPSKDTLKVVKASAFQIRDPAVGTVPPDTVEETSQALHGLRFWDHSGARRHVVAYVSTGGHAMYDYPGFTRLDGSQYEPLPAPRDTHDGLAEKLLPWTGKLVTTWGAATGVDVKVNFVNVGEAAKPLIPYTRFKGQWGCNQGLIATLGASWSGPFSTERHPRPYIERAWGDPPVEPTKP